MEKILSISVAAYNVETMITQNLDSFVRSGVLDQLEILVTDDGSQDHTPELVQRYAEQYPDSIVLLRQQNAGPGSTVNSGIDHATGRYFRMVDGDDWVNAANMPALLDALAHTEADLIACGFTMVDHQTGQTKPVRLTDVPFGQTVPFGSVAERLLLQMHQVIYKTALWKQHQIHIDSCFYTDVQYLLFPIPYVKTALFLDLDIYQYRVALSGQSMSSASMQRNLHMHDRVLFSLIRLYEQYRHQPDAQPEIRAFFLRRIREMAGTQMGVYLSFAPDAAHKKQLYDYFQRVKAASTDVFAQLKQFDSYRLLRFPVLYPIMAKRFRRKMN